MYISVSIFPFRYAVSMSSWETAKSNFAPRQAIEAYRRNAWTLSVSLRDYTRLSPIQDPIGVEFLRTVWHLITFLFLGLDTISKVSLMTRLLISEYTACRAILPYPVQMSPPKMEFRIECEFGVFPYQGFISAGFVLTSWFP